MEDLCQSEINKKIPIRISWIKNKDGFYEPEISLDIEDFFEFEGSISDAIVEFKKKYFTIVNRVSKIMPKNKSQQKASHYWKIGKLLHDFNNSIKNKFEIINFNEAIIRDFGLYGKRQTSAILQFGKEFEKKDISDSIPFSHYLELLWITSMLIEYGVFKKEKKRLLKMVKEQTLPNRNDYRKELSCLTNSLKKKIEKVTR